MLNLTYISQKTPKPLCPSEICRENAVNVGLIVYDAQTQMKHNDTVTHSHNDTNAMIQRYNSAMIHKLYDTMYRVSLKQNIYVSCYSKSLFSDACQYLHSDFNERINERDINTDLPPQENFKMRFIYRSVPLETSERRV